MTAMCLLIRLGFPITEHSPTLGLPPRNRLRDISGGLCVPVLNQKTKLSKERETLGYFLGLWMHSRSTVRLNEACLSRSVLFGKASLRRTAAEFIKTLLL